MKNIVSIFLCAVFLMLPQTVKAEEIIVNKGSFLIQTDAFSNHEKNEELSDLFKEDDKTIQVFNVNNQSIHVTQDDVYLMAQVVNAESLSEPYTGKVAVASVILNRLKSPCFPKTIKNVITQKEAFSCVSGGKLPSVPDPDSYKAVMDAINGSDPIGNDIFYYNPRLTTSPWMINVKKRDIKIIGNHTFFAAE